MNDPKPITVTRGDFRITTDRAALDLAAIHAALERQYWGEGLSPEQVQRSVECSLNFGMFRGAQQMGFARVLTDYSALAYLNDIYILEPYRGQGLSKWLMETILAHPDLQHVKRLCLGTRDAHGLYAQFGFHALKTPERWMEIFHPEAYKKG